MAAIAHAETTAVSGCRLERLSPTAGLACGLLLLLLLLLLLQLVVSLPAGSPAEDVPVAASTLCASALSSSMDMRYRPLTLGGTELVARRIPASVTSASTRRSGRTNGSGLPASGAKPRVTA